MRKLALLPIAVALMANGPVQQAAQRACITGPEFEGLALAVLPEVIRSTSTTCRPHIPASALLARPDRLIAKYQAESAGAWPMASRALAKMVDPEARELLQGEMGRAMLPSIVGPMIAQEIKPKDCAAISRGVELAEPLPARNMAGLLAMIVQVSTKANDRKLPVCPFAAGR